MLNKLPFLLIGSVTVITTLNWVCATIFSQEKGFGKSFDQIILSLCIKVVWNVRWIRPYSLHFLCRVSSYGRYKDSSPVPRELISTSSTINNDDNNYLDDDVTTAGFIQFRYCEKYVIPKPQLCNQLLSFKSIIIGYRYPVNMVNDHYARNSFNFNFCFVFIMNWEM
ncbi:unnamed protein product [Candida parapsilosis]